MVRCSNCGVQWRAKDIWKLGFLKQGRACPSCGKRQYISSDTQRLLTLGWLSLLFIPFVIWRIKLSSEDEPLW
ncbi:hypothetical protein [Sporosarcina trichiuri]|uniref:hypothetical protein n=1 Tax=Sporosarcina trichiuri TaxID=3056445 RepID=UPI0025B288B9|nr:hypothetical protein [Sporosarcina sp. 0.2-SM1T-5]WJY28141.1 hypothetical protein QWT68_03935 [Sporosarcina sp. 0.2-SM1T-5]